MSSFNRPNLNRVDEQSNEPLVAVLGERNLIAEVRNYSIGQIDTANWAR